MRPTIIPPLPEGEGRGEGEARKPTPAPLKPCPPVGAWLLELLWSLEVGAWMFFGT